MGQKSLGKRLLSATLIAGMLTTALPTTAFAAGDTLEGYGTKSAPYQITDQADFQKMFDGGYDAGTWFRQMQDITLTGEVKSKGLFTYNYDGNGYQINCTDINVSESDTPKSGGGLFGGQLSGAIIMNVDLTGNLTHITKYGDAFANNLLEQSALVNCATSLEVAAVAGGQVSALVWHAGTNGKTKSVISNVYTTNVSSMAVIGDNTIGNSVENVYGVGRTDSPRVSGVTHSDSISAATMNNGRAAAAASATEKTGVTISEDDLCTWAGDTNPTMEHKDVAGTGTSQALLSAQSAANNASYTDLLAATKEEASAHVQAIAEAAVNNASITVAVSDDVFTASTYSVPGSYRFKIQVSDGTDSLKTDEKTMVVLVKTNTLIGEGTKENPYQITNQADFQVMQSGDFPAGSWFRQTQDITLVGEGKHPMAFVYNYDGNGYQIDCSNINISCSDTPKSGGGLFGANITAGSIMNVYLSGSLTHASSYPNAFVNELKDKGALINCASSLDVKGTNEKETAAIVWHAGTSGTAQNVICNIYTTNTSTMAVIATNVKGGLVENVYGVSRVDEPRISGVTHPASISAETMNGGRASAAAAATEKTGVTITEDDLCTWEGDSNPTMVHKSTGSNTPDAALTAAQTAAENAVYADTSSTVAATQAAATAYVKGIATAAVANGGITVAVTDDAFVAAVDGTASSKDGTPGSYKFKVQLTNASGSVKTAEKSIVITAKKYVDPAKLKLSNLSVKDNAQSKLTQMDGGAGFDTAVDTYNLFVLPSVDSLTLEATLQFPNGTNKADTDTVKLGDAAFTFGAATENGATKTYTGTAAISGLTEGAKDYTVTVSDKDGVISTYTLHVTKLAADAVPQLGMEVTKKTGNQFEIALTAQNASLNAAGFSIQLTDSNAGAFFANNGFGTLANGAVTDAITCESGVAVSKTEYNTATKTLQVTLEAASKDGSAINAAAKTKLATLYFVAPSASTATTAAGMLTVTDASVGDTRFADRLSGYANLVSVTGADDGTYSIMGFLNSYMKKDVQQSKLNVTVSGSTSGQITVTPVKTAAGEFIIAVPENGEIYTVTLSLPGYVAVAKTVASSADAVIGAVALRAGDMNANGAVDTTDRAALIDLLYTSVEAGAAGDFDGNGKVNGADLSYLLANIGK